MLEYDFSKTLGDVVRLSRFASGLTQDQAAERTGMNIKTLINIENHRGNPTFQTLCPIIRGLQINPNDIFYPENIPESPVLYQLHLLIASCDEKEAEYLLVVCQTLLKINRSNDNIPIR